MPPMMLLSLQRDTSATWNQPRALFVNIACAEEQPTTPLEISKTLSRLPFSVRQAMLTALEQQNKSRPDGQVWTISNLWTWSKKNSGDNDDPNETLQDVVAYVTLAPGEQLPDYKEASRIEQ